MTFIEAVVMLIRFIGALVGLTILSGCSGPPADIESNCSATGRGDVECEFHNKGKGEGTTCVKVVLTKEGETPTLESRPICSGIVKPGDIVQRQTNGGFNVSGVSYEPITFCGYDSYSSYGSWTDNCSLDVLRDNSGGDETPENAG